MDTASLLISLLISSIGIGYFIYGKKASNLVALISGLIMMIYPYFVSNPLISFLLGIFFCVLPFILR